MGEFRVMMNFCMAVLAQTCTFIQFCIKLFRRGSIAADVLNFQARILMVKIQAGQTFVFPTEEAASTKIINRNLFKICMHGSDYITKPMQLVKGIN